jgi:hypothetical protein
MRSKSHGISCVNVGPRAHSLTLSASVGVLTHALINCPLCLTKRVLIVLVRKCLFVASALALAKMQLSVIRCTVLYVSEYTFASKILAGLRMLRSAWRARRLFTTVVPTDY